MKNTIYIFLLFLGVVCFSCKNSSNEDNEKSFPIPVTSADSSINKIDDSIVDSQTAQKLIKENNDSLIDQNNNAKKESKKLTNDWSIDDFIIKCSKNYEAELRQFIEYEKEQWENVANPFIAS